MATETSIYYFLIIVLVQIEKSQEFIYQWGIKWMIYYLRIQNTVSIYMIFWPIFQHISTPYVLLQLAPKYKYRTCLPKDNVFFLFCLRALQTFCNQKGKNEIVSVWRIITIFLCICVKKSRKTDIFLFLTFAKIKNGKRP